MDADSSYGGSDTAQDSTLGHDSNSLETTIPNHTESTHDHHDSSSHQEENNSINIPVIPSDDSNVYYKNEITLPINYDENELEKSSSLPHYLSTAKLNIEESLENHNNLDELSKNYSSTHNLNSDTPKSRKKSTSGIDNPAFQEDENKLQPSNGALKSTFDENKTYSNGDLNSSTPSLNLAKTDEQMAEAVNLELINLKPTGKDVVGAYENSNGITDIPVKKETEVEIGNPYDEYFVPVNEHRKYMRGEKLYVTKDKRDKKTRNKCLCWGLCLAIVAAAVIVGILAAVGVIGNPEAHPVQEARHFDDSPKSEDTDVKSAGGLFGISNGNDQTSVSPDKFGNYPLSPEPPINTISSILPSTDTSMIEVPHALESQIVIDNLQFSEELADKNSFEYQNLAETLERELKTILFSNDVLKYGASDIELKVMEITEGSVVIKYRIGWVFKNGIHNPKDPIDKETLENKLHNALNQNYGYIDKYHIQEARTNVNKILDMCQINQNDCEHTCSFDYKAMNFKCECPSNQYLDKDEKTCIFRPEPQAEPSSSTEQEPITDFEFDHTHMHLPQAHPKYIPTFEPLPTAEPTAEPEPQSTHSSELHHTIKPELSVEFIPSASPEPSPEPEPTTEPIAVTKPVSVIEPEPTAEPLPAVQPESTTEPVPEPKPEPMTEPVPSVEPQPTAEPIPVTELEPTQKPESTTQPKALVELESSTKHHLLTETEPIVKLESVKEIEVTKDPEPSIKMETTMKSQSTEEPKVKFPMESELHSTTEIRPTSHLKSLSELTTVYPEKEQISKTTMQSKQDLTVQPVVDSITEPNSSESTLHSTKHVDLSFDINVNSVQEPTTELEQASRLTLHPEIETSEQSTLQSEEKSTDFKTTTTSNLNIESSLKPTVEPTIEHTMPSKEQNIIPLIELHPTMHHEINITSINPEISTEFVEITTDTATELNLNPITSPGREAKFADEQHALYETNIQTSELTSNLEPITEPVPNITFKQVLGTIQPEINNFNTNTVLNVQNIETTLIPKIENELSSEKITTEKTDILIEHNNPVAVVPEHSLHETAIKVIPLQEDVDDITTINTTQNLHNETILNKDETTEKTHIEEIATTANNLITNEENSTNINEESNINVIEKEGNYQTAYKIYENVTEGVSKTTEEQNLILTNHTTASYEDFNNFISVSINNVTHQINNENDERQDQFKITTPSVLISENNKNNEITKQHETTVVIPENQSSENIIASTTRGLHHNIHTYDVTENLNTLDNMSPFLPEIENDTLVNILHSDIDHFTDIPFHSNETYIHQEHTFHITEKPPRLDNDEMNVTNPQDPQPTDTVLGVLPIDENKIRNSNEVLENNDDIKQVIKETTTKQSLPETTTSEMVIKTQETTLSNIPKETIETTTVIKKEPTLSPDILNNVHSNNYFLKLQTSTESSEQHTEPPQTMLPEQPIKLETISNPSTLHENFTDINISTEDLIALETTTKKLNETKELITETANVTSNATTINAEMIDTVTDIANFTNERFNSENSTEIRNTSDTDEVTTMSSRPKGIHQYEVHEHVSDYTTTIKNNLTSVEAPLPVIPLIEENTSGKIHKQIHDKHFNKLESVDSIYDPSDFLNDISDEEKVVLDKFLVDVNDKSTKSKKDEKEKNISTKLVSSVDNEKDHYIATDFTDKATFTYSPKGNTDNAENDFYIMMTQPKTVQDINNKNILTGEIKPVTEGFTLTGFSRCAIGQFQCQNGTAIKSGSYCVSNNDRCDSVDDCTDASDEFECAQENCLNNFQCLNGQCLKRSLVCDGIIDCNDGSDEQNCEMWKCRFDEFSCGDGGRCIPLSMKCDGRAHCPNNEDEYNCHAQTCSNNAYHCINQGTCIPGSWRCDGIQDCAGGVDENLCECAVDQIKCTMGGGCIPKYQKCDGIEQCSDLSDEWNCIRLQEPEGHLTNPNYIEILSANETWLQVCSDLWNTSYSDQFCQNLGYALSTSTEIIKVLENSTNGYYKLKPLQRHGVQLLAQLEKTDGCDSVVSINCQEFVCGSHTALDTHSARIIGGSSATETQWPSVTLLYNKKHHRQCTATLIAPRWIVASHSCIYSSDITFTASTSEWMLYAGGTNFFSNADNSSVQIRLIKDIIPHPQTKYTQFVYKNDIVLVELSTPLVLGQNVSAICLPNKDIEPRQLCVTAGWGISKPGDPSVKQYLHYLPVPTIDMEECNSTKHYNGRVTKDKICAGYTDSDKTPCYNDEGAPLMCFSDIASTWELHGLLSYHANCGRNHHPALYSAINEDSRQWIANTVGLKVVTNQRVALNKK